MIKNLIRKFAFKIGYEVGVRYLYDLELQKEYRQRRDNHKNPLNKFSLAGFSQADEDGITLEILNRMGLERGSFVEFGVGNGTENNTIILLAAGWRGTWFGGSDIAVDVGASTRLRFNKVWITRDNIVDLYHSVGESADVVSLDLDGNDIYFIDALLQSGVSPKLFIAEYNGKFPPTVDFQIPYDENHRWRGDDYYGVSLKTLNALFRQHDYTLVCCSNSGVNAFFVHNSMIGHFGDIPTDIEDLYCEPFYFFRRRRMHPTSAKTIEALIKS